jgi:hypothetical protein
VAFVALRTADYADARQSLPSGRVVRVRPFGSVVTSVASGSSFSCHPGWRPRRWWRLHLSTRLSSDVGPPSTTETTCGRRRPRRGGRSRRGGSARRGRPARSTGGPAPSAWWCRSRGWWTAVGDHPIDPAVAQQPPDRSTVEHASAHHLPGCAVDERVVVDDHIEMGAVAPSRRRLVVVEAEGGDLDQGVGPQRGRHAPEVDLGGRPQRGGNELASLGIEVAVEHEAAVEGGRQVHGPLGLPGRLGVDHASARACHTCMGRAVSPTESSAKHGTTSGSCSANIDAVRSVTLVTTHCTRPPTASPRAKPHGHRQRPQPLGRAHQRPAAAPEHARPVPQPRHRRRGAVELPQPVGVELADGNGDLRRQPVDLRQCLEDPWSPGSRHIVHMFATQNNEIL